MTGILLLLCWTVLRFSLAQTQLKGDGKGNEVKAETFWPIDNDNLYESIKPGQYKNPVIFEPIKNIRLSISSYQVTMFIDLTPYFEYFESYEGYLDGFLKDLADQSKMSFLARFHHQAAELGGDFVSNELDKVDCEQQTLCEKHSNSKICQRLLFSFCMTQRQYYQVTNSTVHIKETFMALKNKFLGMIDYMDETLQDVSVNKVPGRTKRHATSHLPNVKAEEKQQLIQILEILDKLPEGLSQPRGEGQFQPHHVEAGRGTLRMGTITEGEPHINKIDREK